MTKIAVVVLRVKGKCYEVITPSLTEESARTFLQTHLNTKSVPDYVGTFYGEVVECTTPYISNYYR